MNLLKRLKDYYKISLYLIKIVIFITQFFYMAILINIIIEYINITNLLNIEVYKLILERG